MAKQLSSFQPTYSNRLQVNPYVDGGDASIYASDGGSWATARNATTGTVRKNYIQSTLSGATRFIERGFFTFDTSSIPDNATIVSARLGIYITAVSNADSPSYRLYDSTHTDTIVAGDYDLMGTTEQSATYLTSPSTSAYSYFTLNAAGLASISKTGKTKFCIREAVYDLGNVQPTGTNTLTFSDLSDGVSVAPILDVVLDIGIPVSTTTKLYMPLNGSSVDISGNGNHGTDTAISYVQGKFGQGARFNGSTSKIEIANDLTITSGVNIILSAWYKPSSLPTSDVDPTVSTRYTIAMQEDGATGVSYQLHLSNVSGTNKVILSRWRSGIAIDVCAVTYSSPLTTFSNVIGTWDGTNLKCYVNAGIPTILASSGTGNATSDRSVIGYSPTTGGAYFDGIIDEVIIENRAWTPQEISLYYRKSMLNYRRKSLFDIIKDFIMSGDTGTFLLTGYDATLSLIQTMIATTGTFIVTGYNTTITLTGIWLNATKSAVATLANTAKTVATWINRGKNQ